MDGGERRPPGGGPSHDKLASDASDAAPRHEVFGATANVCNTTLNQCPNQRHALVFVCVTMLLVHT